MSITATFVAELPPRWQTVAPVRLGGTHPPTVLPERYVIVEGEGTALRCDLYPNGPECHAFEDVQLWRGLLLVGYGCHLYIVNLATRAVAAHRFDSYFGNLTVTPDYCLVASGYSLYRLGHDGQYLWACRDLAVDGVIVSAVENDVIHGQAEMDPPGGWRSFSVRLSDGTKMAAAKV